MSALTNMQGFWRNFLKKDATIRQALINQDTKTLESIMDQLDDKAVQITGAHIFLEYAYDNFELTFDTGPNKTSQYLAQLCVDLAPKEIKEQWILNASLPPLSQKAVQSSVQMKDQTYTLQDFYAFYQEDEDNQMFNVQIYCPGYALIGNPERKKEMSMYVVELAIGLLAYESYMGSIDFIDQPNQEMAFCSLIDFYEVVMETEKKKGWKVYPKVTDIYSVFQPNQEIVHDSLRKDMKYIFSTHPLLVEETLEDALQDVRQDAHVKGASFQYIYYPHLFDTQQDATFRQELSKKMEAIFAQTHCADVMGGAIGKSYAYIDVIVYDQEKFQSVFEQIKKQITQVDLHVQPF